MDIAPIFTAQQNVAHFFDEKHDPSASLGTNLCAFTCLYKPKKLTLHFGQVTMISALLCFTFIPFSPLDRGSFTFPSQRLSAQDR
mmetsp:Transcript_54819/g.74935  ORF Transcript_54819/g.74935 Transcript_54819/m.74935 type:complete len:85 (+) Transcript_54819:282-536(+)